MWTAILATLNLLDGAGYDVWSVNTEADYLEEGDAVEGTLDLDVSFREAPSVEPLARPTHQQASDHVRREAAVDAAAIADDVVERRAARRRSRRRAPPRRRNEQRIERAVERDERTPPTRTRAGCAAPATASREDHAGERAEAVTPAEVERLCARSARASSRAAQGMPRRKKSVTDHAAERPALQVRAEQSGSSRISPHARKTDAELDVLDRRRSVPLGIEAADVEERVAADGAETRPERRRTPAACWCT